MHPAETAIRLRLIEVCRRHGEGVSAEIASRAATNVRILFKLFNVVVIFLSRRGSDFGTLGGTALGALGFGGAEAAEAAHVRSYTRSPGA